MKRTRTGTSPRYARPWAVFLLVFLPAFLRPGLTLHLLSRLLDWSVIGILLLGVSIGLAATATAAYFALRAFGRFIVGAAG